MTSFKIEYVLLPLSIALFVLGTLCENLSWYQWSKISGQTLIIISIGTLSGCALIILVIRLKEKGGLKIVLFDSQIRFIIPWSLTILECVLIFSIFGCHKNSSQVQTEIEMPYRGCIEYSVTLVLTNFIFALVCNERGEVPFLITFQVVLFAQIIFHGELLIRFISHLVEKEKDYSILFISIMIAYQVLVMDLIFRAIYEDRQKSEAHQQLQHKVHKNLELCQSYQTINGIHLQKQHQAPKKQAYDEINNHSANQLKNNHI